MTLLRKRNMIVFECDKCGEEHLSFTDDFHDALDDFKADGGVARRVGDSWEHYCKGCDE